MPIVMRDEYKVQEIVAMKRMPRADEAQELLERIAKAVQPLMRKRLLRVPLLKEFFPANARLAGLNRGGGRGSCKEILLRLRPAFDHKVFNPYEAILHTMVHELTHNHFGPHNAAFFTRMEEMTKELEDFQARGITGTGSGFDAAPAGRIGGRWHNPSLLEARSKAAKAAERRAQLFSSGGQRLGGKGADGQAGLTPKEAAARMQAAAQAAERRAAEAASCGNDHAYTSIRMADGSELILLDADEPGPHARASSSGPPAASGSAAAAHHQQQQQQQQRKRQASSSDLLVAPRRVRGGSGSRQAPAVGEVIDLTDSDDEAGLSPKGALPGPASGGWEWGCAACAVMNAPWAEECPLCGARRP